MRSSLVYIESLLLLCAGVACAQEAHWVNAKVQTRAVEDGLAKTVHALAHDQNEPAWIGYAVPVVAGHHHICCEPSDNRRLPASLRHGRCKLEGRDEGMNFQTNDENDDRDAPENILVLFRAAENGVQKIRVFTDDCELDAGGLSVYWLTGASPQESIAFLSSFVGTSGVAAKSDRRKSETAVTAIALHADPGADVALEQFTDEKYPRETRKDTAFWLGNMRGQKGYEILRRMLRSDSSEEVREQCVFALSISKVPEAVNAMIEAARDDRSSHMRGQALFWLSQKAGEKASRAIADAVQHDPETEVKKKAVFALSQLPKGEGIPKLIEVARVNRNSTVRKEAMFWLGQSNDSRALAFFEEVLTR